MANYPYRNLGIMLDLDNWQKLNDNFKDVAADLQTQKADYDSKLTTQQSEYNGKFGEVNTRIDNIASEIEGEVYAGIVNGARLIWQEPVATFADLATTHPTPEEGWTSMARDTGIVYRFNSTAWVEIQEIDATAVNEVDSRLTSQLAETATTIIDKSKQLKSDLKTEFVRLGDLKTFKDAIAKKYCRIAFVGDSITGSGDYVDVNDRYVEQYMAALQKAFPGVVFEFANFGIGGRTIQQFESAAYTSPTSFTASWATTDGKAWKDYVREYNAHLVFMAFGMNPNSAGAHTTSSYLQLIKDYFVASGNFRHASLVLVTNLVPNKEWAPTNWRDRITSSRQTSLYGRANNISYLDVFNKYRVLIDGKDESNTVKELYKNGEGTVANGALLETVFSTRDFRLTQNITLDATNVFTVYLRNGGNIMVSANQIIIKDVTTIALDGSTGGKKLVIDVADNLKIELGGVVRYNQPYYRYTQDDVVRFGWTTGSGAVSGLEILNYNMLKTTAGFTSDDLYGPYIPGDTTLKLPTGGNGVNHPSSAGYNYFYAPLIRDFIDKFNEVYKKESTIQKTVTFNLTNGSGFSFGTVGNDADVPYLVGQLEKPDGTIFTERKDLVFTTSTVGQLGASEYIIRRTTGVIQVIVPTQTTLTGWKYTSNFALN